MNTSTPEFDIAKLNDRKKKILSLIDQVNAEILEANNEDSLQTHLRITDAKGGNTWCIKPSFSISV